jgi:hypothetical protein
MKANNLRYQSLTARLYQSGLEFDQAMQAGANPEEFLSYEQEFKGGSIPLHLLIGTAYRAPYSCSFHTGGVAGATLRTVAKSLK